MTTNTKKMLINVNDDETRIAQVIGNTLDNLHIEQTSQGRIVGNIYYGKVVKIQTSFQAAFIDYGAERHGFLAFSDVNSQLFKAAKNTRGRPSIDKVLKQGQTLIVQVTRDEIGHKGASLTTNISLPGRFLVFMPDSDKGGVSKKIEDVETRTRLKHLLEGLCGEKDSAIIRTAGVSRGLEELKRDFMMLRRKWNQIQEKYENTTKPQLLFEEEDVVVRILRDFFIDDIAEIWIDHAEAFQRAREFFKASIPNKQKRLQFYLGDRSLFSVHEVETQIEQLSSNQVPLPSGGSLVIDPTEALVAIDVNSGRYSQANNIEETALLTNTEAAEEVARQLRLRNLGGLIVIDFIDMFSEKNRTTVVSALEACLQDDKAKWNLGTISQFGLLEMSRQRIATALSQETKTVCPVCGGMGEVLSISSLANAVLRKIRELAATENVAEIHSRIPIELSNYLFNKKRQQLDELELEFGLHIVLTADPSIKPGILPTFEVISKKRGTPLVEEEEQNDQEDSKAKSKPPRPPRKHGKPAPPQADSPEETGLPEAEASVAQTSEKTPSSKAEVSVAQTPEKPAELEAEAQTAEMPAHQEREASSGKAVSTPEHSEKETSSEASTKTEIKGSTLVPLYSSVHAPQTAEQQPDSPARPVDQAREKVKEIPAGTVMFSSAHRHSENTIEHSTEKKANEVPSSAEQETVPQKKSSSGKNKHPSHLPIEKKRPAKKKPATKKPPQKNPAKVNQAQKEGSAANKVDATKASGEEPVKSTKAKPTKKMNVAKKPATKAKTNPLAKKSAPAKKKTEGSEAKKTATTKKIPE